ncbi:MAG: hypothetical protein CMG74_06945 [Candidatus Marinimicrobia bacterium]|nr:hypothetical protein [Candidatus Neomarinimicrobiota bacterium]|tara:strand:- start:666 stop:1151 length:486 start_codon:yes stop_codon:yes gene_type:complete
MILKKICHICLENKNEENFKKCCSAFICNNCWNSLLNKDINNCPICNKYILETNQDIYINIYEDNIPNNEIEINNNETNNEISTTKTYLRRIIMIFKWLLLGYINTNIIVFIIFYKNEEYLSNMQFLNKNIYFWPLCMLYGYLEVCIYEYATDKVCQLWYN